MHPGSGVHLASHSVGNRVSFPGGSKGWCMKPATHLHVVQRVRKSGTVNPLAHLPS